MNTARRGRKRKPPERNKFNGRKSTEKEGSYICKDCGRDCKVEDALKWHMLTRHEKDMRLLESYEKNGKTDYRCICDVCTESFRNKMEIRKHIKLHHLNNHDEPEYECNTCGQQFTSDGRMNRHILKMHNAPIPNMFWLECEDCDQMFQSQSSLKRHLLKSHKKDRRIRHYGVLEPAEGRYECEHCGHFIKRRCILKRHLEKVHNLIIDRSKPPKKPVVPKGDFIEMPELLMRLLPVGFEYKLKSFQHKEMDQFIAKFHFIVYSVECGKDWLKDFLSRNNITMTKLTAFKSVRSNVLHKERLHCHRNTRAKDKGNKKHTNCPAQVSMSIRKLTSYDEKNVESVSFECIVILRHLHNHRLDDIEEAKYRKPLPEVVQKFERMFEEGIGPSRALGLHQQNVQEECGDEYYKVSGDRSIIPDIRWVFYQHTKHRMGKNPENAKQKKKKEVAPTNDCGEVASTDPDDPSYKDVSEAIGVEQKATKDVQQTVDRTHACLLCSRKYLNYRSLRIHALLAHRNQADEIAPQRRQAVRKCALCKKYKIDVTGHYQTTHGVEMIQEYLEFLTYKSFCEWKSTLEETTQLKHVIGYDVEHYKEYSRLRYTCVQSRTAQQRRDHGFCPAEIDVRVYNNDHCSVSFLRTHVCALRPQSKETQPYVEPAAPDYSTNIWNCTILPDGTVETTTPILIDAKDFYKIDIDKDFYKINMDQVRIEVLGDVDVEVANISHMPTENEAIMCSLASDQQDAANILCHEDANLGMVSAISDIKLEEIKNRLYRLANELPSSLGDPKDVEYIEYIIGAGEMYINGSKQNICFIDGM